VLRFLGVEVVVATSFARIHAANLVNFGIVPLLFADPKDLELLQPGDALSIPGIAAALAGDTALYLEDADLGRGVPLRHQLSARQIRILQAGGLLNLARPANVAKVLVPA
jgi:aconitate hydratase